MYKKILVPLDGSEFAEKALPHAKSITKGCGVEQVVLLRVVAPIIKDVRDQIGAEQVRQTEVKREQQAQEYLEKKVAELKKENINVSSELAKHSDAADKILEYSVQNKFDLIVMSTHGRTGVQKWVFGSVANKVMVNSYIPVLMVTARGSS
jgi:nucleotide-binding universal stress UspA family protein